MPTIYNKISLCSMQIIIYSEHIIIQIVSIILPVSRYARYMESPGASCSLATAMQLSCDCELDMYTMDIVQYLHNISIQWSAHIQGILF